MLPFRVPPTTKLVPPPKFWLSWLKPSCGSEVPSGLATNVEMPSSWVKMTRALPVTGSTYVTMLAAYSSSVGANAHGASFPLFVNPVSAVVISVVS